MLHARITAPFTRQVAVPGPPAHGQRPLRLAGLDVCQESFKHHVEQRRIFQIEYVTCIRHHEQARPC